MADFQTIYTNPTHQPDPTSAFDVLAFVLAPTRLFAGCEGDASYDEACELLMRAKEEAATKWAVSEATRRRARAS